MLSILAVFAVLSCVASADDDNTWYQCYRASDANYQLIYSGAVDRRSGVASLPACKNLCSSYPAHPGCHTLVYDTKAKTCNIIRELRYGVKKVSSRANDGKVLCRVRRKQEVSCYEGAELSATGPGTIMYTMAQCEELCRSQQCGAFEFTQHEGRCTMQKERLNKRPFSKFPGEGGADHFVCETIYEDLDPVATASATSLFRDLVALLQDSALHAGPHGPPPTPKKCTYKEVDATFEGNYNLNSHGIKPRTSEKDAVETCDYLGADCQGYSCYDYSEFKDLPPTQCYLYYYLEEKPKHARDKVKSFKKVCS